MRQGQRAAQSLPPHANDEILGATREAKANSMNYYVSSKAKKGMSRGRGRLVKGKSSQGSRESASPRSHTSQSVPALSSARAEISGAITLNLDLSERKEEAEVQKEAPPSETNSVASINSLSLSHWTNKVQHHTNVCSNYRSCTT
jgi:hypothetical protein